MTYPILPSSLPGLALRDDWTVTPDDPMRRTEMDDGAIAQTRRHSQLRTVYAIGWELSELEYDMAVAFWADILDAGQCWFLAPIVEGRQTKNQRVRFASSPPWVGTSPANGRFKLTFELEVKDLPRMSHPERMAVDIYLSQSSEEVDDLILRLRDISSRLAPVTEWP